MAFEQVVPRHKFSLGCINLLLQFIIFGGCSLHGASCVFKVLVSDFQLTEGIPCWTTCRLWLMRLGYYKLSRPKEKGADWIWIIDHTNQLDQLKCLLILGLRLRDLPPRGQPLKHSDLEPIELFPVLKSTGEVVYEQLEKATEKTGVPRAIVSDHGSDLNKGVALFRQAHPQTAAIYDIKHKTAALLKRELHPEERWQEFVKKASATQSSLRQTVLFPLAPPSQKTKARYMNLEELLQWGKKTLFFLENKTLEFPQGITRAALEEKLGWVTDFSEALVAWQILMQSIESAESLIRKNGLEHGSFMDLKRQFAKLPTTPQTVRVQTELLDFVQAESMKAHAGERLLGASEALESTFGKLKTLEGAQNKNGFTGFVLAAAAIVAPTTPAIIYQAMTNITTKTVLAWQNEHIGKSAQAKRKMLADQYASYKKNSEQTQPLKQNKNIVSGGEKTTIDSRGSNSTAADRSKFVNFLTSFQMLWKGFIIKEKDE
jgi:hypothetical protein